MLRWPDPWPALRPGFSGSRNRAPSRCRFLAGTASSGRATRQSPSSRWEGGSREDRAEAGGPGGAWGVSLGLAEGGKAITAQFGERSAWRRRNDMTRAPMRRLEAGGNMVCAFAAEFCTKNVSNISCHVIFKKPCQHLHTIAVVWFRQTFFITHAGVWPWLMRLNPNMLFSSALTG